MACVVGDRRLRLLGAGRVLGSLESHIELVQRLLADIDEGPALHEGQRKGHHDSAATRGFTRMRSSRSAPAMLRARLYSLRLLRLVQLGCSLVLSGALGLLMSGTPFLHTPCTCSHSCEVQDLVQEKGLWHLNHLTNIALFFASCSVFEPR